MHSQQRVDDDFTHARMPAREAGRFQSKHEMHDGRLQRLADADRVRADQVALQGGQLVLADALVGRGQRPEDLLVDLVADVGLSL